ncbi:MAG: T9SS type A sorting domain-containing protein [Elusimicrobiales bacterium]|nr:T9SS type A sorting domain-containing protein [Elusimicrobiales bacterium]
MKTLFLLLPLFLSFAPGAYAALSGGAYSVPFVVSLSGGGPASGGVFSLSAANLGGPSFSSSAPSGGAFSVITGGAPALLLVTATARGDLGAAHCYPVPFRQSQGHTKITFTGLTRAAAVRVYTISGELVRALEKNDSGETLDWDLKNSRGQSVVSGVYIYTVKSGSQKNTGKLMVIW